MKRAILLASVAPGLLAVAAALEPLCQVKPWDELSDTAVSRLGRAVLRGGPGEWVHAESAQFIGHAASEKALDAAVRQAEYAYREIGARLGLSPSARKAHLFVVSDRRAWGRLRRMSGWREDGRAITQDGEIFVMGWDELSPYRMDIAHEIVHLRLQQAFGADQPLWMEEGLAAHLGWQITKAYHELRGTPVERKGEAPDAGRARSVDELAALRDYPGEPADARAFAAQAEAWVGALARKLEPPRLGEFVTAVAGERVPWREALTRRFGWSDEDVHRIERVVAASLGP